MKKLLLLMFMPIILFGCGQNGMTQTELQANEWVVEAGQFDLPFTYHLKFHENSVDLTADRDSVLAVYEAENGEANDFTKMMITSMMGELDYSLNYTVDKNNVMVSSVDFQDVPLVLEKAEDGFYISVDESVADKLFDGAILDENLAPEDIKIKATKK